MHGPVRVLVSQRVLTGFFSSLYSLSNSLAACQGNGSLKLEPTVFEKPTDLLRCVVHPFRNRSNSFRRFVRQANAVAIIKPQPVNTSVDGSGTGESWRVK